MRSLFAAVAALLVRGAALAEPAAAPSLPPNAAVFAAPAQPSLAQWSGSFEAHLSQALLDQGVQVADPSALFPGPAPASLKEGDALFEEGRDAYNNLDPDTAAKKLAAAAAFYARHPAEVSAERLSRTFIFLGSVWLLNGNKDKAVDWYRRALTLSPQVEPESDLFGPDVHALFAQTRDGMAALLRGTMTVTSTPSGAKVVLDGAQVGPTPVDSGPLPIGRHLLVVTRPGYVPFGAFPDVEPEATAEVAPSLEPTPGMAEALERAQPLLAEGAFKEARAPDAATALGQTMQARFLVLSRVGGPDAAPVAEVQAWDLATGNKLVGVSVTLSRDDWRTTSAAAVAIAKWIAHPPSAQTEAVAFEAPPLLRKWWFWAAVGGVAVVAAGAVAVSQADGHRPDFVLGLP